MFKNKSIKVQAINYSDIAEEILETIKNEIL